MFFMSGSQGQAFAMAARTMTERIRKLGPNPLKMSNNGSICQEVVEMELEDEADFRGRRPTSSRTTRKK
jgi:hypothetical protein